MTADLRALLQEARDWIQQQTNFLIPGNQTIHPMAARIDAALAESAPEPTESFENDLRQIAAEHGPRAQMFAEQLLKAEKAPEPVAECINVDDDIGTLAFVWADGFERKVGMKLYTAPPPANGEDAKGRIVTIGALLRSQLRDDIADRLAKLTAEQRLMLASYLIDQDYMVTVEDFDELIGRLPDSDLKC